MSQKNVNLNVVLFLMKIINYFKLKLTVGPTDLQLRQPCGISEKKKLLNLRSSVSGVLECA